MNDVEEIIINADVVENGNKPISVHSERREDMKLALDIFYTKDFTLSVLIFVSSTPTIEAA